MKTEVGSPGDPDALRRRGPRTEVRLTAPGREVGLRIQGLVSTGTPRTTIDATTAARLGLESSENAEGEATVSAWIEIDGLEWPRQVRTLRTARRPKGCELVIGMDLLCELELRYDGSTGSMTLSR